MSQADRGPLMFDLAVTLLALSTVTVVLRCYVRIFMLKTFRGEDYFALATQACYGLYCAAVIYSCMHGGGKHIGDVLPSDIPLALKARWFGELAFIMTSVFLKFTVGLFLLRICSRPWQNALIWTVLAIVLLFNVMYFFLAIFQCRPVYYFWTRLVHTAEGQCVSEGLGLGSTYAAAGINAITDWTLGLLPIALVWDLKLTKRSKLSVAGILGLGIFASTATIVRIPYIWQLTHSSDFLYTFTDFTIWSTVENGLGIMAASIATLRPLFKKFLGSSRGGTTGRQSTVMNPRSVRAAFHCRGLNGAAVGGDDNDDDGAISMVPQAHLRVPKTSWDVERSNNVSPSRPSADDSGDDWRSSWRGEPVREKRMSSSN